MSAVPMNQAPCAGDHGRVGGAYDFSHRAFSQFGIPKVNILLTPQCLCRDRLVHLSANGPEGFSESTPTHVGIPLSLSHTHTHTHTHTLTHTETEHYCGFPWQPLQAKQL